MNEKNENQDIESAKNAGPANALISIAGNTFK